MVVSVEKPLLVSVLTVVLLFQLFSAVWSDEALVRSICDKTPDRDCCMCCLNQFAYSTKQDIAGLAGTIMKCADSKSTVVIDLLEKYRSLTNFKEYNHCVDISYAQASDVVESAIDKWVQIRAYADADQSLDSADRGHLKCFNMLLRTKRLISAYLSMEFSKFITFYNEEKRCGWPDWKMTSIFSYFGVSPE